MADHDNRLEERRSQVRVWVTYIAAFFVFFGGALLIAYYALFTDEVNLAKDIFLAILPIATGVVTFWFAGRAHEKAASGQNAAGDQNAGGT